MSNNRNILYIDVGRRAEESEQLEFNWEPKDINSLNFPEQGKIVCVLGGNNTNRPEAGNGNAKIFESMIPKKYRNKTNIYSFIYKTEPFKIANHCSNEYVEDINILYEKVFMPMLFNSKGYMKTPQGIEKTFKRLILASHCGGSYFANIIISNFYNTLIQEYPPATAELLINKIQYISYAPLEMPIANINGFVIAPFSDINSSWFKAITKASESRVDIDYPKNITKKLIHAKETDTIGKFLMSTLQENRALTFKIGNSTYIIPGPMNPRLNIGDHSIDCIAVKHILESGTAYAETAQIVRYAAETYMKLFLSDESYDNKKAFSKVQDRISESQSKQKAF